MNDSSQNSSSENDSISNDVGGGGTRKCRRHVKRSNYL